MSATLSQSLAMLFTGLFLILNDPPAVDANEDTDLVKLLTSQMEIQGKVYGIMDRCHTQKDPNLELGTLVKRLEAKNTSPSTMEAVKDSYLNGIQYASQIDCQYSETLLKDLQEQYRGLIPDDQAAIVADVQR